MGKVGEVQSRAQGDPHKAATDWGLGGERGRAPGSNQAGPGGSWLQKRIPGEALPVLSVKSSWCVVNTPEPWEVGVSPSGPGGTSLGGPPRSGGLLGVGDPTSRGSQPSPAPLQALSSAMAFLTSVSPGNRLPSRPTAMALLLFEPLFLHLKNGGAASGGGGRHQFMALTSHPDG